MEILGLVKQSQTGDAKAFGQIYDLYADRIFRFVRLKIQDQQTAEDILQDVFFKAWQGLPKLPLTNLNFNAWIYKIASNTINDHFRKIYRRPQINSLDEAGDAPGPDNTQEYVSRAADVEMLKAALEKLAIPHRTVLELRFIQDFNLKETADILGKSNLAVRLLQHRALKQLKTILNDSNDLRFRKIQ